MIKKIDTGDTVKHGPTGESWIVACIDYERNELSWVGWPEGWAKLSDCVLVEKATEEERDALLTRLASMQNVEDHRRKHAEKRILEMKRLPQPEISITVSKTQKDHLTDVGKMVLTNYNIVLEKQATVPLNFIQVFAGAVLCLGVGTVFGVSYAKSAGFYFALATGMLIGTAVTLIYIVWKASKES